MDDHGCPMSQLAFERDDATCAFHGGLHHGQSEARAAAGWLRGEEHLERALPRALRHADTGIGHGPAHETRGHILALRWTVEFDARRLDQERPAARHGLPGVSYAVENDLLDVGGVQPYRRVGGREAQLERDICPQKRADYALHP